MKNKEKDKDMSRSLYITHIMYITCYKKDSK